LRRKETEAFIGMREDQHDRAGAAREGRFEEDGSQAYRCCGSDRLGDAGREQPDHAGPRGDPRDQRMHRVRWRFLQRPDHMWDRRALGGVRLRAAGRWGRVLLLRGRLLCEPHAL
jgi:hypothetical protein